MSFEFDTFMICYPFRKTTHEEQKGQGRIVEHTPQDVAERSPWSAIEELEDEAIAAIEAAAKAVAGTQLWLNMVDTSIVQAWQLETQA